MTTHSIPSDRLVVTERRSMSLWTANLVGFALLGGILLCFGLAHGGQGGTSVLEAILSLLTQHLWFFGVVVVGILVHEGIHALTMWRVAGVPWSEIEAGIEWAALTPYVHTSRLMTAGAYRAVALSPALLLGVLPALVGIGTGSLLLTLFGALFSGAAGGDLLSVWRLRGVASEAWVQDADEGGGCEVVVPIPPGQTAESVRGRG